MNVLADHASDIEHTLGVRLSLWLPFGVVLGVLPVMANYLFPVFTGADAHLLRPLADGELLIASSAIAGGALGELIQVEIRGRRSRILANIASGATFIFCVFCALGYAAIKTTNDAGNGAEASSAVIVESSVRIAPVVSSVLLFIVTVGTASGCIAVAAKAKRAAV